MARVNSRDAGVFVDFDGTLSDIVGDPGEATAVPGAGEALAALAERFGRVVVVSGRPVAYLADRLADSGRTELIGLYGMQASVGRPGTYTGTYTGTYSTPDSHDGQSPDLRSWTQAVERAAASAEAAAIAGLLVERKGLTVALHYRGDPTAERAVSELAEALARITGLSAHPGKMSIELAPSLGIDKGTVVKDLSQGLKAVLFAGDDMGDLPAFRVMDQLAGGGVAALKVAVGGDEAPEELIRAADLVVDAPEAVVDMLRWIAASIG